MRKPDIQEQKTECWRWPRPLMCFVNVHDKIKM